MRNSNLGKPKVEARNKGNNNGYENETAINTQFRNETKLQIKNGLIRKY